MNKKGINLDQFRLRNLMVSFVFAYDPQKLQKSHLKKLRHNWVCFRRQKHSIWGSKIELLTWNQLNMNPKMSINPFTGFLGMVQEWSLGSVGKIGADIAVESKFGSWPCSKFSRLPYALARGNIGTTCNTLCINLQRMCSLMCSINKIMFFVTVCHR